MNTLKIVCPHCRETNAVKNEVSRNAVPCSSCGGSLLETAPVACDAETFKVHIVGNDIPVLADFYSPDCAPCMQMAPDYESAASQFAMEVRFVKVNCLDAPDLARQYGVNKLPTIIAFKHGMEVNRFSSSLSKDQIGMWAESLIQMTL